MAVFSYAAYSIDMLVDIRQIYGCWTGSYIYVHFVEIKQTCTYDQIAEFLLNKFCLFMLKFNNFVVCCKTQREHKFHQSILALSSLSLR